MEEKNQIIVTSDFYGGSQGIDDILNDYYEREIRKIGNQEEQTLARKFIEEGLIIDGSRVSVSEVGAINQFEISEELLQRLRNCRLIRAENTHLGKAYEVSHDTLVAPILKSYEKRKRAEEKIENAKKLEAEHRAFEIEKKKRRRANILAGLGFLLFFVASIALFKAIQLNKVAQQQSRFAQSNALTAHSVFETQNKNDVTKGYGLIKAALSLDDDEDAVKGLFWTYYKATNSPKHYFYIQDFNCQESALLSAYYSPLGNYMLVNAWNKKACLLKRDGTFIRNFLISANKPRKRVFFSNDEKHLLVLGRENEVEVYKLEGLTKDSKPIAILSGHKKTLLMANFSSDGQRVLTCAKDGKAMLWNKDWQLEKEIDEPNHKIYYANFSPDGTRILTINKNGSFQVRDENGEVIKRIENLDANVRVVSCSSNYFAIASPKFKVKVWDWEGQKIVDLIGHKDFVKDISWSPNGELIATSSPDKTAKIWDLKGNILADIDDHHASVLSVDFSPDGKKILSSSVDNTIMIWNLDGSLDATLSGHFEKVTSAMFHPDGNHVLSFSEDDKTVKEWLKIENHVLDFPTPSEEVFGGRFSSDGKKIATNGSRTAALWEYTATEIPQVRKIARLMEHDRGVICMSFSPDDSFVATGSYDDTGKIWDTTGVLITTLSGHTSQVGGIEWSPDGQQLVTASHDNTAKVWNTKGRLLFTLSDHKRPVLCAKFSPNGKYIITGSADATVKVWDRKGDLFQTMEGHESLVLDAVFSERGNFLVTASEDKTARIWNMNEGSSFGSSIVLKGHLKGLQTVVVSPDEKHVLTSSEDKTAILWTKEGRLLHTLSGHENSLQKAIFSHNGEMIATASSDNTAKIWDMDGNLVSSILGHKNTINDICFSPDDQWIFTAGSDQRIKLWPVIKKERVIQLLDKIGVSDLSEENKKKYNID